MCETNAQAKMNRKLDRSPSFIYSCLMSVYRNEKASFLRIALLSILDQTVPPSEIVVVKDGPLTDELDLVLEELSCQNPGIFKFIEFPENQGLWKALRVGLVECSNELVLRMDSDDYSEPGRALRQLDYMAENPECACCGCCVDEFEGSIDNIVAHVSRPVENDDIVAYAQRRNPFSHPTMLYRKQKIIKAGNYREMLFFEDYDLTLRMIEQKFELHNLNETLVRMRVSPDFYKRRGGFSYLKQMVDFRRRSLKSGYIHLSSYMLSVVPHAIVSLLPNRIREFMYKKFLRESA